MGEPIYLDTTELAERLHVDHERVKISIEEEPMDDIHKLVVLEMTIDGKDLTPEQEAIAEAYVQEKLHAQRPRPVGVC